VVGGTVGVVGIVVGGTVVGCVGSDVGGTELLGWVGCVTEDEGRVTDELEETGGLVSSLSLSWKDIKIRPARITASTQMTTIRAVL
jgi:hypothetical protein